jgi:hypothetical protein
MKQLLIVLLVVIASCTSHQSAEQQANEEAKDDAHAAATVPLNSGTKWKADEATRKNVAAMVQVVEDSGYADATKRKQLYASLQSKTDTLIKQCRMQGAEHDALHVWLERVLKDMKEVKEEDNEYHKAYAVLKKDVKSFYDFFE